MRKVGVIPGRLHILVVPERLFAEEAPAGWGSLALRRLLAQELVLADQFLELVDLLALLLFLFLEGGPTIFQLSTVLARIIVASLEAIQFAPQLFVPMPELGDPPLCFGEVDGHVLVFLLENFVFGVLEVVGEVEILVHAL